MSSTQEAALLKLWADIDTACMLPHSALAGMKGNALMTMQAVLSRDGWYVFGVYTCPATLKIKL
eukprot:749473-Pelagomonas_calceolata.AAC.2